MALGRKLFTFLRLGPEKHLWVLAFTLGSLLAWVAIRTCRMKRLGQFLGEHQKTTSLSVLATQAQVAKAWAIGQVMAAVGRNVPWECKCLAEALCVKWMLDRYRIPSVTFLGAYLAPEDAKGMKAHAWLAVERKIVIGGRLSPAYQVTAVFAQTKF
ncbi:MAG: hypothetical protein RL514_4455 [Verrucomicrobiota bacterium]|jgi:hypothetical protein